MKNKPTSFLKNHADTLAIIGVNLAIGAIALNLCFSNMSSMAAVNARVDAANTRMDTLHTMFYDLLKEGRK
tara:strand:+ start:967 stop:1179 length:213 start_codon:yes stop_codon:yes gene_type:complete